MGLRSQFKTDTGIEVTGVWIDYDGGCRIKIARAGGANKRYLKAMEALSRKYKRQLNLEILPVEVGNKLMREVFATTIVLEWKGVTEEDLGRADHGDSAEVPCSVEAAMELFEFMPDIFSDLQECANSIAIWREEIKETESKN